MQAPIAFFAALVLAAPAGASLYRATLTTPSQQVAVVKDMRWVCVGAACAAPRTGETSDAGVCAAVARKLGRLARFEAADRAFDEAQLARCNGATR